MSLEKTFIIAFVMLGILVLAMLVVPSGKSITNMDNYKPDVIVKGESLTTPCTNVNDCVNILKEKGYTDSQISGMNVKCEIICKIV